MEQIENANQYASATWNLLLAYVSKVVLALLHLSWVWDTAGIPFLQKQVTLVKE